MQDKIYGQPNDSATLLLPHGIDLQSGLVPSTDGRRVAYVVRDGNRMRAEVNGHPSRWFDAVSGITVGNETVAFVGCQRGQYVVSFNDREGEFWDDIGKTSPTISPDGRRIAYTARRRDRWFAVIDDTIVGGPYEGFAVGGILFSPDSRRCAYMIKRGDLWLTVVDGHEQQAFPTTLKRSLTFSPDSSRIAYVAGSNGRWRDGAYVGDAAVVVDGVPGRTWPFDGLSKSDGLSDFLTFSQDSTKLAYFGARGRRTFVAVNDEVLGEYEALVSGWSGNPLWTQCPGYGKVGVKSDAIVFSPDSRRVAYGVNNSSYHAMIVNGNEEARHGAILNQPPYFSHDSRRLGYGIQEGGEQKAVVDGIPLRPYYGLLMAPWAFSQDSKHLAYAASDAIGHELLVIDEEDFILKGQLILGSRIVWEDSEHVRCVTVDVSKVRFFTLRIRPLGEPREVS